MYLSRGLAAFAVFLSIHTLGAQTDVAPPAYRLMPVPAHVSEGTGGFAIDRGFHAKIVSGDTPRLDAALQRTMKRLERQTGLVFIAPAFDAPEPGTTPSLTIAVATHVPVDNDVLADESYALDVTTNGIRIAAATDLGAMHGLETLMQLVESNDKGFEIRSVSIQDKPRFRWRGLMIDCSRHFEPIEVLERNIDAMAAVKLNVFHWHLIDDQGFRIESKRFPRLTALGSDGQFYTQDQARELVAYAYARGVRVVPEFEMPGHSSAWLVAYPELNSGTQPEGIRREFGVSPYVVDPTREESYQFIATFLAEMATIFPDPYVHIGGDEAPAPDWKSNPRILAFMSTHGLHDNAALQAYFNHRVLEILAGLHKQMVGWDEIFNPALPKDVVVQSWRGVKSLTTGAEKGYQGILSAPYYLDHMDTAAKHYLADPLPADSPMTSAQRALILGGEVCMWGEFVDPRVIDSRIWPRAAAVAERLWSPASVRDVNDMYRRLDATSIELEALGLTHLQHKDASLRELVGSGEFSAMRLFADAFEPAPFSERSRQHKATTMTPLSGFVDALVPDPPIEHRLAQAADVVTTKHAAGDQPVAAARALLQNFFDAETKSAQSVRPQLLRNSRLAELEPRASQLLSLTQIGSDSLRYLDTGTTPKGWKQSAQAEIAAARKPSGLVRFDFLDALVMLVGSTP